MTTSSFRGDSANLDLIRAFAVCCVFFAHLYDVANHHESELGWHFAQMGVLIFFVHTSMVLMLSLERLTKDGISVFKPFYVRRALRLYPLSIFCVCLAFFLKATPDAAHPHRLWTLRELLSNLALTTNLTYTDNMVGGLWTLPLEVQMYVLLPLLFLLTKGRTLKVALGIWCVALLAALTQPHISARLSVLSYAPCFVAGVLAWRLTRSVSRKFSGRWWPLVFICTWPLFLTASREYNMYFRWVFCLALGLVIPWFTEMRLKPITLPAHQVAKYSYGIYLSHIGVMLYVFALPVSPVYRWLILVSAAIAAPVAMFHFIENPFIQLGRRLPFHSARPAAMESAGALSGTAPAP